MASGSGEFQLYQRAGTSNWWMRFSLPGEGQIRKSLKTSDEAEANRLAAKEWHRATIRHESGLKAVQKTFRQVAEEFIAWRNQQSDSGEKRADKGKRDEALIRRFFIPFFADKPIEAIRDADVVRYQEFRRDYWTLGAGKDQMTYTVERGGRPLTLRTTHMRKTPSAGTIRGENIVLNEIFDRAVRWGYLDRGLRPEVTMPKAPPAPRPSFSGDEMKRLAALAQKRMEDPAVNDEVRRDRSILYAYILIAAHSGMRPTEMRTLDWGDVLRYRQGIKKPSGERDVRIRCRGKGKSRELVPLEAALAGFDILWMLWKKDHAKAEPTDASPVFANKAGFRLTKLSNSLNALLDVAALKQDHRGKTRDAYSFRHFYISQQLLAGVDVFVLARNTGTSPQMIDKHYGQVSNEQFAAQLRPQWRPAD